MSRYTDIFKPAISERLAATAPVVSELPPVDWTSIGQTAPQPVTPVRRAATDPLPPADIVVITWTNAEWSALDHVFVNSNTPRGNASRPGSWSNDWRPYSRAVGSFVSDDRFYPLWGDFRQVTVAAHSGPKSVLLFHSNAHLQYQPYIAGLRAMVTAIAQDTRARQIYSIGTAGGGTLAQALGDAVITNSAQLLAGKAPNDSDPANGQTFTCTAWYPPTSLLTPARSLMFKLSGIVTQAELAGLFSNLQAKTPTGSLKLADLINRPLQQENLGTPTIHNMPGVPLNTSCNYGMAPGGGSTQFAAYEEDDAAVGQAAGAAGADFVFVRNVSDTVVPDHAADGTVISSKIRQEWAGLLYDRYGWVTASNGAIAAWGTIAVQ